MVTWSEELYRLHGLDPNLPASPYKDYPSLFTAESWDRLQSAVKALKTGTSYELDLEIIGSEPTTKWVIARGEPLRDADGQIIGLRGTVQDITARKQAEQAQRESEDKLRLILDSTAEAIYGIDLECRCTFCNSACLRALGYEHADELLGKNMHHLIHQLAQTGRRSPSMSVESSGQRSLGKESTPTTRYYGGRMALVSLLNTGAIPSGRGRMWRVPWSRLST